MNRTGSATLLSTLALLLVLASCEPGREQPVARSRTEPGETRPVPEGATSGNLMDVTITDKQFHAPKEIASGWVTFRVTNRSPMVHFALVDHMPAGHGIEDNQREVAPPFQDAMNLMAAGDTDAANARFGELPDWFADVFQIGGTGLISPGGTAQATVYLEPGTYLLECYVKTDGIFHGTPPSAGTYGMVHEFQVLERESDAREPKANVEVTVSSERGIEIASQIAKGRSTVAVHFADQHAYGNFVGHDVHVAQLAEDTDLEALERWMDWRDPAGLSTPAPVRFLGGLNEMPVGSTGYFTIDLQPGRYALISEVPNARESGLYREFTVAP